MFENNYLKSHNFLPDDMWNEEIIKYLNPLDVFCVISSVCNYWRRFIVNNYFHTYLKDHISFLRVNNTRELFNNINLLQKYKRYLFRKYIQQIAHQFAELFALSTNNNDNAIEKKLTEMQMYCKLFNLPKNIQPLRFEDNPSLNFQQQQQLNKSSSCFGFNDNKKQQDLMIDNNYYSLKSLMVGNLHVGKTSFLKASVFKRFGTPFRPVGIDFRIKEHQLGQNYPIIKLQIWDTNGQERFRTLPHSYYRGANCFYICFDLTNRDSFQSVNHWKEDIDKNAYAPNNEIILLGMKLDLTENLGRKVERKEAEELEFEMELIYEEISNKEMMNVDTPTWYFVLMQYCLNQFKRI